ncbi:MAG: c-type cytochrome [Planctomycetes bacterium]|nr:c-type cytochrome [Planctomycetota bacterium]
MTMHISLLRFLVVSLLVPVFGFSNMRRNAVRADDATAARKTGHPIVAGFERFHSGGKADLAAGGRLLLGELNCTSCHKADDSSAKKLLPKQAPILDRIGSRVNVAYLRTFIADPQAVKPGTTMPQLFAGDAPKEKSGKVEALVHFLVSTGSLQQTPPNRPAADRGRVLFHRVGCVACHGSRQPGAKNPPGVIPLGEPAQKYSIRSLTEFLQNPLKTRPSGRMPDLKLTAQEANDIAHDFLRGIKVPANLTFKYYEGNWATVPDFSKIRPKATGGVTGFDLNAARRKSNFGMRFEGFLQVQRAGEYTFFLGSDDGSKLFIDGKLIAVNDGVHPYTVRTGKVRLAAGAHPLIVDYTQLGGEWVLRVDYQGPGVPKQSLASAVTSAKIPPSPEPGFKVNPQLAARGKQLFVTAGCASCHQLNHQGKRLLPTSLAKPLKTLQNGRGCIAANPPQNVPHFHLNERQRRSLAAVIENGIRAVDAEQNIAHTMTALNCYACHSRGKIGGPPRSLNPLFLTTIKEMGDEGRIPPPLDGVGDKLTTAWLKQVMENGANDRPYMLTHMPKFGLKNVGGLIDGFVQQDRKKTAVLKPMRTSLSRVKSAGRFMVGEKAYACIKCHTFGKYKATGIQSLDLTTLTKRIREDWFYRYMMRPIRFRPGTRMPTPFPGGVSQLDKVLDGTPAAQMRAMWVYMQDGAKARVPLGLVRAKIELVPKTEPIIYRNFIQGVSPRGIAVGYPGGFNLAFDADRMTLSLLWHGPFIDASKHWLGRGQGFQSPLGDHILTLPKGPSFASLTRIDTKWPTQSPRDLGYKFLGYRLDADRQPVFRYRWNSVEIEDYHLSNPGEIDPSLRRILTVKATGKSPAMVFRAAVGKTITPEKDGWYRVDKSHRVRVSSFPSSKPFLRKSAGGFELLIPVRLQDGKAILIQEIVW